MTGKGVSPRGSAYREADLIDASADEILEFMNQFELSPGQPKPIGIKRREIPFYILSDGLDIYIEYILRRFRLDGIPYRANRAYGKDANSK